MKHIKPITEALKGECQTPDAEYTIKISNNKVTFKVQLPMKLDLTKKEAKLLETNIHNAMEIVLAPYFTKISTEDK